MRRLMQPVEEALTEWLDQQAANTSRKATAYKYLARFPVDFVVAVALRTMVDKCTDVVGYTPTCLAIATWLEAEERAGAFERDNRKMLASMCKKWDERGSTTEWRQASMVHRANLIGVEVPTTTGAWIGEAVLLVLAPLWFGFYIAVVTAPLILLVWLVIG